MTERIFELCPDCVTNRSKLKAFLADIFCGDKLKINILMDAYDEGIVDKIEKASVCSNMLQSQMTRLLILNHGISEERAVWAVNFWVKEYGILYLGKGTDSNASNKTADETVNFLHPFWQNSMPIEVKKLKEEEKIPKRLFDRDPTQEKKLGITDLKCSIRVSSIYEKSVSFKVTGEYFGKASKYLLIFIMFYNANGELIEANFHERISKNFSGRNPFSCYMQTPTDEYLSRIAIKIMPDTTFC